MRDIKDILEIPVGTNLRGQSLTLSEWLKANPQILEIARNSTNEGDFRRKVDASDTKTNLMDFCSVLRGLRYFIGKKCEVIYNHELRDLIIKIAKSHWWQGYKE
jgi:hypothetical protein